MKARRAAQLAVLVEGKRLRDDELDLEAFRKLNSLRDDPKALKRLFEQSMERALNYQRQDVQDEIVRMFGTFEKGA